MAKNRETQWAVGLAIAVLMIVIVSGVIFGIAYMAGGSNAVSDNWVGVFVAIALLGGLIVSPLAFVLAVTAMLRHGRSKWLWIPLVAFPGLLAFVILGETLWWE